MAKLEIKNLSKSFDGNQIIQNINFTVEDGEFCVLVGASGCGKSTLLRIIAGLDCATSGEILIDDVEVSQKEPIDRSIAMVFQSYALYPHMTVAENIGFSLHLANRPKQEIDTKVLECAKTLQLDHLLTRKPKHLSGGQRQRVAIGRAIVRSPKIFLFDEPLSNLDAALRSQMRVELSDLHKKLNATMVYVTHDQVEAMTMADKIIILNAGQIEQIGSPMECYLKPQTPFVAGFIGSPKMNLFEEELAKEFGCGTYGIRPEHIDVSLETGLWTGQITYIEKLGADMILYVRSEKYGSITVRTDGESDLSVNQTVFLTPRTNKEHKFISGKRI